MSMHALNHDVAAALERTNRAQASASDPSASVWVSANAGTGKTHVLTNRVLRILIAGTPPERILCLTYTKAAAAEMSKRVFKVLGEWVTAAPAVLEAKLARLLKRTPTGEETDRARTLFARAIETPGGLKVQTIHAFSERLLQRFPLEAGVPPGFLILEDEAARTLRSEATDVVLARATSDAASPLALALDAAIAYAAGDQFDEVLTEALRYRPWLAEIPRLERNGLSGFDVWADILRRHLGVRQHATSGAIEAEMSDVVRSDDLASAVHVLSGGGKTDAKLAAVADAAHKAPSPAARVARLEALFLTGEGEPRKTLMTKALAAEHPELAERLGRAQDRFAGLARERAGATVLEATLALTRIAEAVLQEYTEAKARRAALDFDDLIARTASLLATQGSPDWVLFKLDGGLDHILVDESQDTSPEQWRIVGALAEEFFAGTGAREEPRSLFAVGDEKQSIYSFQGAAPRMFASMGDEFARRATRAGVTWRRIPLDLSFRTVEPVLGAVDRVFADSVSTPGVTARGGAVRHVAKRAGSAGIVELWPTEVHDEPAHSDTWSPLDETPPASPVARLADRIAKTIERWLETGERLASEDRTIRPGDILVLVRKRRPFADAMVSALKARGVPVAGADRIALVDQIAVQDLMALGDFLTLPEDDLALASVLKSPLVAIDDEALMGFAPGRKGTLWKALLDNVAASPLLAGAAATLKRWRKAADFAPPYEFFSSILDKDGGRQRLLARLGPDAADPIDEFLNLALTYDDSEPPSLTGFLAWLRSGTREIKRDMEHGRDEVRVMTVHGAKGLEAPIVFLPDTCGGRGKGGVRGGPLKVTGLDMPVGAPDAFVWPVKGTSRLESVAAARNAVEEADAEERDRLLYVAMTRARDRLYVAGFEGRNGREQGCWYDMIEGALAPVLETVTLADGTAVRRWSCPQTAGTEPSSRELSTAAIAEALPSWATHNAPREPQLTVPLAPSRLAPYEMDETGEPTAAPRSEPAALAEPPILPPGGPSDQSRFLRGTLTHALLEHLPSIDAALRPKAAKVFVAERGRALSARVRASVVAESLAVLDHPTFAPLFGPESRAEVPIVAEIPRPKGSGPALRLTGQIDRLAIVGGTVLIVDYKTNRPPPRDPQAVSDVYLYQLAAYALALGTIFPGSPVRAALLWTCDARLMEIPPELLERYMTQVWTLDPSSLDA